MDHNSSKNQRIKGKFVEREVYYCVSMLIYELAKDEKYFEDLFPLCVQDDYEEPALYYLESITKSDCIEYIDSETDLTGDFSLATLKGLKRIVKNHLEEEEKYQEFCELFDLEPDRNEAYEHWIVSDYLARKLETHGHITGEFMGMTIWGRQTSGQAILLDSVISSICEEMEILEGQAYEWKV